MTEEVERIAAARHVSTNRAIVDLLADALTAYEHFDNTSSTGLKGQAAHMQEIEQAAFQFDGDRAFNPSRYSR